VPTEDLRHEELWSLSEGKSLQSVPHLPAYGTEAAFDYFQSMKQINRFFSFVLKLVAHIERAATIAHEALVDVQDDEVERAKMIEEWRTRRTAIDELAENRQFFLEIILVRQIENFLSYLSASSSTFLRRGQRLSVPETR
jgi:hypothetical protein